MQLNAYARVGVALSALVGSGCGLLLRYDPDSTSVDGGTSTADSAPADAAPRDAGPELSCAEWGPFGMPELIPELVSMRDDWAPTVTGDELEMIFYRYVEAFDATDMYVTTRRDTSQPWDPPVRLDALTTDHREQGQHVSGDLLYYASDPDTRNRPDIYLARRSDRSAPFVAVGLVPGVSTDEREDDVFESLDGRFLYFASTRDGSWDLFVAQRSDRLTDFGPPTPLDVLNDPSARDDSPALSADGTELFFASDRPGGEGRLDLWVARRATPDDPFEPPENMGSVVNGPLDDVAPHLSTDGRRMYFNYASVIEGSPTVNAQIHLSTRECLTPGG